MTVKEESTTGVQGPFDVERLRRDAGPLNGAFVEADPFPHLVLDGYVSLPPASISSFPDVQWSGWNALGDSYQLNKRACDDATKIPEPWLGLIRQLSEPRFLEVLEAVTGIKQLIPDPYLTGGGLHLSGPGGILAPHTDFHRYRALGLFRRVNVLVYLNQDWTETDGGCLSFYRGAEAVRTVVPAWGRTVIFRTDDASVHGFPEPVAEGRWRRSVALYYYTAEPAGRFSGDETTYWREHGELAGPTARARFTAYKGLLNLSRVISQLAHVVNPHQGLGLVRTVLANRRRTRTERRG